LQGATLDNAPAIYDRDQDISEELKAMKVPPSIMLSLIAAIGPSPLALAVPTTVALHSPAQVIEKSPQKLAQFPSGSQERSQLVQQANALYNQRDFKGAETSLRQLIKKYPEDAFGHFQLGNVLLRQKQPEAAIKSYEEAIRLKPKYALAYNAVGVVYATQDRWNEAITEYRKALEINPNYGEAMTNLGQALWQINKRDEAVASLEKALTIFKTQSRNDKVYQIEQMLKQIRNVNDPSVS
jgi:tetratricopeptide (TPR) repeat protein